MYQKFRLSLSFKFFVILFFVASLPIIAVGIVTYNEARSVIVQTAVRQLEVIAESKKERLHDFVQDHVTKYDYLINLYFRDFLMAGKSKGEDTGGLVGDGIFSAVSLNPEVLNIELYDKSGRSLLSYASTSTFLGAINPGDLDPGDSIVDVINSDGNISTVAFLRGIYNKNDRIGFYRITTNIDALTGIINNYTGLGLTGDIVIAKKDDRGISYYLMPGRFYADLNSQPVVDNKDGRMPIVEATNGIEGTYLSSNTVDYRGAKVFAVSRFIPNLGWGLVIKFDQDEILEPVETLFKYHLLVMAISILLVASVAIFAARLITNPIDQLVLVVRQFSEGNLGIRSGISGVAQFGLLSNEFNIMAEKIQNHYTELEDKVAERTKDLQVSKKALEDNIEELEKLNKFMIDRELKIVELKEEISKLKNN